MAKLRPWGQHGEEEREDVVAEAPTPQLALCRAVHKLHSNGKDI